MGKESIFTAVGNCARCGGNHPRIEFKPFEFLADKWTHWAMCPEKSEPILLKQVPEPTGGKKGEVILITMLTLAALSWLWLGIEMRNEARKANAAGTNTVEVVK